MTPALQYRIYQPDKLLESLEIELTPEQQIYLKENKHDLRTLLLKKFNLRFGTSHTKLQLTRAIEVMYEPKVKPTGIRDPNKIRNVYYRPKAKMWEARITFKKKRYLLYLGTKAGAIKAVEKFKKKHGIKINLV